MPFIKNPGFLLRIAPLLAALFISGCVGTGIDSAEKAPLGAVDTQPQGPLFSDIKATGDGASVEPAGSGGEFSVKFPASDGKPTALFSFAKADIDDRLGVALDVSNHSFHSVRIYADLNSDTWVRGYVTVPPWETRTLYVFARRLKLSQAESDAFPRMHGIPGGKMSLWAGIQEPITAASLKVFMVMPQATARLRVGNLRPFGSSKMPDLAGFYPFIDRYGQYSHKDWPGKTHSDADLTTTLKSEDQDLASSPGPPDRDQFGGWAAGPLLKATGHFRVEKYQGKWWFVDPEGRLFWSDGIDGVGFNSSMTGITGRERFYEDPAPKGDFLGRNLEAKYGPDWRNVAQDRNLARLKSWGLNTLGNWSDPSFNQAHKIPYALGISSREFRTGPPIDPDSPAWAEGMRRRMAAAAAVAKDDPWCIGYFVDNEIHTSLDPAWFDRYYRQVSAMGKELMPNLLYFGSRLDYHDWPDEADYRKQIVRIAAKYCDVISFNFYKFTLDDVALPEGIDKPAIVGEFHMGALDRGKFHTGLRSVINQDQRAEAYRYYVTSALRNPAIVGAHWFQFYDESTTGRFDGEDYQIGFLDVCDTPYVETVAAARDVGYRMYLIRSGTD
jgi:hypothetical protein